MLAFIDEAWCIGCTLCLKACPTDAILGGNKRMHTVIEVHCTGCELCIPVCPVDCIYLENTSDAATGWQAWSPQQATSALERYTLHRQRYDALDSAPSSLPEASALPPAESAGPVPTAELDPKRAAIAAALARARALRSPP